MRASVLLLFVLFLVGSLCCVSATTSVSIPFCSGTKQLRNYSALEWVGDSDGSAFVYQFCTTQRRLLSSLRSGRVKVGAVNLPFRVCESDMDCIQKSIFKQSNGLYCFQGNLKLDFPLNPSPTADTVINVQLLDTGGNEVAMFCASY